MAYNKLAQFQFDIDYYCNIILNVIISKEDE